MSKNSYLVFGADGSEHILGADEIRIRPGTVAGAVAQFNGTPAQNLMAMITSEFNTLIEMIQQVQQQTKGVPMPYSVPVTAGLTSLIAHVNDCKNNLAPQFINTGVMPHTALVSNATLKR